MKRKEENEKETRGRKEERKKNRKTKQQKPLKRNLAGDGGSCFLPLGAKQPNQPTQTGNLTYGGNSETNH